MAQLFTIEPDILRLDDRRIDAFRNGFIDEMDLVRLIRPEDPFQMIGGTMHFHTKEEREKQTTNFIKNQKGMFRKYGGLNGMSMRTLKDHLVTVFPELLPEYAKVEEEIKKEQCADCVANQKYQKILDMLVTNPEFKTRDVSHLEKVIPPLAMKVLKDEYFTDDDIPLEIPKYISKVDIPFVDEHAAMRDFDPSRDTVVRKSCWDCTKKHLSEAIILMSECLMGYGADAHEQKWEMIGHLSQAAKECAAVNPDLSAKIRKLRMKIMKQKEEAPVNA